MRVSFVTLFTKVFLTCVTNFDTDSLYYFVLEAVIDAPILFECGEKVAGAQRPPKNIVGNDVARLRRRLTF